MTNFTVYGASWKLINVFHVLKNPEVNEFKKACPLKTSNNLNISCSSRDQISYPYETKHHSLTCLNLQVFSDMRQEDKKSWTQWQQPCLMFNQILISPTISLRFATALLKYLKCVTIFSWLLAVLMILSCSLVTRHIVHLLCVSFQDQFISTNLRETKSRIMLYLCNMSELLSSFKANNCDWWRLEFQRALFL
jgi:hypothetical protein